MPFVKNVGRVYLSIHLFLEESSKGAKDCSSQMLYHMLLLIDRSFHNLYDRKQVSIICSD